MQHGKYAFNSKQDQVKRNNSWFMDKCVIIQQCLYKHWGLTITNLVGNLLSSISYNHIRIALSESQYKPSISHCCIILVKNHNCAYKTLVNLSFLAWFKCYRESATTIIAIKEYYFSIFGDIFGSGETSSNHASTEKSIRDDRQWSSQAQLGGKNWDESQLQSSRQKHLEKYSLDEKNNWIHRSLWAVPSGLALILRSAGILAELDLMAWLN